MRRNFLCVVFLLVLSGCAARPIDMKNLDWSAVPVDAYPLAAHAMLGICSNVENVRNESSTYLIGMVPLDKTVVIKERESLINASTAAFSRLFDVVSFAENAASEAGNGDVFLNICSKSEVNHWIGTHSVDVVVTVSENAEGEAVKSFHASGEEGSGKFADPVAMENAYKLAFREIVVQMANDPSFPSVVTRLHE